MTIVELIRLTPGEEHAEGWGTQQPCLLAQLPGTAGRGAPRPSPHVCEAAVRGGTMRHSSSSTRLGTHSKGGPVRGVRERQGCKSRASALLCRRGSCLLSTEELALRSHAQPGLLALRLDPLLLSLVEEEAGRKDPRSQILQHGDHTTSNPEFPWLDAH